MRRKTSPGCTSSPNASHTASVAEGRAPTCTGMCSACATRRPVAPQIAVEKSRLELRICEKEVRSIASPISSTMPLRRCWTTETVIGSTLDMRHSSVRPDRNLAYLDSGVRGNQSDRDRTACRKRLIAVTPSRAWGRVSGRSSTSTFSTANRGPGASWRAWRNAQASSERSGQGACIGKAGATCDGDQVRSARGGGGLGAGLEVRLVVEDHEGEIRGPLVRDGREDPERHQELAVAGEQDHAPLGLREREAEGERRGLSHRAVETEVAQMITDRAEIPGTGSKTGDHEQARRALLEEEGDARTAAQHGTYPSSNCLAPIIFCESSTATD